MRDTILAFFGIAICTILAIYITTFIMTKLVGADPAIARFQTLCTENRGHIYKPSAIYFCLTQDGRFIEIYP